MYKIKKHKDCEMPGDAELKVLVLNASLKHVNDKAPSNTEEVAQEVLDNMPGKISSEIVRLADKNIPLGLGFKESDDDEWPSISEKIIAADIVIFATPIWWGQRSSLMQRIIERMDAFDEEAHHEGREVLLNKVAGVVVTGSEDGAQHVGASIIEVLTFMNFTLPPQCIAYWVGEVGEDPKTDRERRKKNQATKQMAKTMARNLAYYGQLMKMHPLRTR